MHASCTFICWWLANPGVLKQMHIRTKGTYKQYSSSFFAFVADALHWVTTHEGVTCTTSYVSWYALLCSWKQLHDTVKHNWHLFCTALQLNTTTVLPCACYVRLNWRSLQQQLPRPASQPTELRTKHAIQAICQSPGNWRSLQPRELNKQVGSRCEVFWSWAACCGWMRYTAALGVFKPQQYLRLCATLWVT